MRSEVHWSSTLLALIDHDYERMLAESQAMVDLRVGGSSDWICALTLVAWAEIELGHVERAARRCDEVMEAALRHVRLAGVNDGLELYSLLMHSLDEPEVATILRGQLSKQKLFPWWRRSERDLDGWIEASIPPDRRDELAARGASMTPSELQAIAREAALRHVEPQSASTVE